MYVYVCNKNQGVHNSLEISYRLQEILESLLILKSEIFNILYDISYTFVYKSINSASCVPMIMQ